MKEKLNYQIFVKPQKTESHLPGLMAFSTTALQRGTDSQQDYIFSFESLYEAKR